MTGNEIRAAFLNFFEDHDHRVVRSSSLLPAKDPTLLFSNAGMNQFKDVFLGKEKRDYARATSSQKCVRAGGKHNDLENVGRTRRHHTFFEMLGNFSFGDYFKDDAVAYAWTFLTENLSLPQDRLVATIFKGEEGIGRDDEAERAWAKFLPADRILELGLKDNFWAMGDTGPCGPCSEVHYHQGDHLPCEEEANGGACEGVACECDRWVEIWNLVFMQYDRDASGGMAPLPAPCVDTGMGLERLAAVLQGKTTNYDTDLILPIIKAAGGIAGRRYGEDAGGDVSLRVIADHIRAGVFLISDGIIPSNEGRGYVLRKIIRRAARHGRLLGIERPFLTELIPAVQEIMGEAYPEILEQEEFVRNVLLREEDAFGATIALGMQKLQEAAAKLPKDDRTIPGEVLFKLYDTFGFPLDLAEDIARDEGFGLDLDGYEAAMARQKDLARQSWKGKMDTQKGRALARFGLTSAFLGYDALEVDDAVCTLILKDGERVDAACEGDTVEVAFDRTPAYAESGGQVGDRGAIRTEGAALRIHDTQAPLEGLTVHESEVLSGTLREGDRAAISVDREARERTAAHHTATHLLHAALREILGTHVKQAGSLVAPTHLRFDFQHYAALEERVLDAIEERVNEQVLRNTPLGTEVMDTEKAVEGGAMALFGEKYGDSVRVVSVPGFSKELCGGTHVARTGEIGLFKFTAEHSVSAGVRRVEAVCHMPAYHHLAERAKWLDDTAGLLNTAPEEVHSAVLKMIDLAKNREKELSRLRLKAASSGDVADETVEVEGLKLVRRLVEGLSGSEVKNLADTLRDKAGSGIVVIGNRLEGKATITVAVTPDQMERVAARDLVRPLGKVIAGGGGGKPDIAEAGGKAPEKLQEALDRAPAILKDMLNK